MEYTSHYLPVEDITGDITRSEMRIEDEPIPSNMENIDDDDDEDESYLCKREQYNKDDS